jgi:uncharacterized protein (TIGR02145 family)
MKKIITLVLGIAFIYSCSTNSNENTNTTLIDIDGNTYSTVVICNQTWTAKNLNVSKYSDGTPIPQVTDPAQWGTLTTGAWCYYDNATANGTTYGKLYNWYAVVGIYDAASASNPSLRKKLAPTGWHIPADIEWTQLIDCLGGASVASGKMKSTGTSLWLTPNIGATNQSGFTALPGGCRYPSYGEFNDNTKEGYWWSSSEADTAAIAWYRSLNYNSGDAYRSGSNKTLGLSVRCLKD